MSRFEQGKGLQFLTIAEAAEHLGQSRLRVREAAARGLLGSRRDNEGRLRIDIPDSLRLVAGEGWPDDTSLAPDKAIEFLFDEIEELRDAEAEKDGLIRDLTALAERQADAIERAGAILTEKTQNEARLSALLDRALAHLDQGADRSAHLKALLDHALGHLETTEDKLGEAFKRIRDLERGIEKARSRTTGPSRPAAPAVSGQAGEPRSAEMQETAERAMALLEDALARAEVERAAAFQTCALLERALDAGDRFEQELSSRDQKIEESKHTIETALALTERAVAAASSAGPAPERRGLWRWLTRR